MSAPIMPCVGGLRLMAQDDEDLAILSAHVQDAVCKIGDLVYLPKENRFLAEMNRFCWYSGQTGGPYKRYITVLHFEGVLGVKARNLRQDSKDAVVELLSILFEADEEEGAPDGAGFVTLVFSGGGELRLKVECLEARLKDLVGPYLVYKRPEHLTAEDLDERRDAAPERAAAVR